MEYEKASKILRNILDKNKFTTEETEAVQTAISVLTLATMAKNQFRNRARSQKDKRDKDAKW